MVRPERSLVAEPLLSLAREAIRLLAEGGDPRRRLAGRGSSAPRGCFVSLKKSERLRGCMGTMVPSQPTLEEEIVANAVAAARRDPRFKPVQPDEVKEIQISIDLLSALEVVASPAQLDPRRYGLLVRAGNRSGVLLPDLPGVRTVERQVEICREKAGIEPHEPVTMERFTVERISE